MGSIEDPNPSGPEGAGAAVRGAGSPSRELEAAPYVRAEAREELLALSRGRCSCARGQTATTRDRSVRRGAVCARHAYLSQLRVTVDGTAPVLLSSTMESGHHAVVSATNPMLRSTGGAIIPQDTLNVRCTLLVDDRLHYEVRVRNFGAHEIATTVEVALATDFADVFAVRGVGRRTRGRLLSPETDTHHVRLGCVGEDGERRQTIVELRLLPVGIEHDERGAHATWEVSLGPRKVATVGITAEPVHPQGVRDRTTHEHAAARLAAAHEDRVRACAPRPPLGRKATVPPWL